MLDYFGILNGSEDTCIYNTPGVFVWSKPKGSKMVYMMALGAGGGGRGGSSGVGGQEGGGGGSSGAVISLVIPAVLLPDKLYVRVGAGGAGGAAGAGAGSDGLSSLVSLMNTGIAETHFIQALGGLGATLRTGAADAGIPDETDCYFSLLGLDDAIAGDNGANGGVNTGANGSGATNNRGRSGGGGGAGCSAAADFTGGTVGVPSSLPQKPDRSNYLLAGGVAGGGAGIDGPSFSKPFLFYGGSGGGSNFVGTGGAGGKGSFGCGGGGGGAGVTGGVGGRGGDGLVILSVW